MRRVALVLLVALGAVLGPAGAARAEFGISDAGPGIFTDWRFTDLGVRHVRLVVPWDVAVTAPQATDAYVQAALRTGVAVHVAFEHGRDDRCPGAPCTLPSVADYREAFAAFRRRWPSVVSFTTWNEASHVTQPTAHAPARVAEYLRVLTEACADCELVGPDVLDADPGLASWLAAFRAAAGAQTGIWGLHDYGDPNGTATVGLDAFIAQAAGAPVWLTETGGIVRFRTEDGVETMGYDEARAARAVAYALALADAYAAAVPRVYLHSFTGGGRMDTGLVGPEGATRPAYDRRGHLRARGCGAAAFSVAPGRRGTALLHCATRPRRGAKLALTVTQAGVTTWHARVTVR